jgi:copper(I)-binding protein
MPFAKLFSTAVALVFAAAACQAHSFKFGAIDIGHPWARPTAAGQPTGGGYLKLANGGPADKLLSASSDVAAAVELHSMSLDGNVMRMRQVDAIDLPAGQTVELKPGGLHLMLVGLKAPLKEGASFPLKLRFEKAGEVTVDVKVGVPDGKPAEASAGEHRH